MALSLTAIEFSMAAKKAKNIERKIDSFSSNTTLSNLNIHPGMVQWLIDSYIYVKKRQEELKSSDNRAKYK